MPLLDEKGIDYFLPLERSSERKSSEIRLDFKSHILNRDAILIFYDQASDVWVREQLGIYMKLKSKRETPLKIIAVHKAEKAPDLNCQLNGVHIYCCPPKSISTYLPHFIEALA